MAFWAVPNRTRAVDGENGIELYGDFQADEASDLASVLDGVTIAAGSTTQIIKMTEPTFVTLGTDGTWYPEQSGAEAGKTLSMSPTLKKAVDESDGDTIDLTEDDIDKINDELGIEPFPEPAEKKAKAAESEVTEDER